MNPSNDAKDSDFHPDSYEIASCGGDGRIAIWDSVTATNLVRQLCFKQEARVIRFTPDGSRLVAIGTDLPVADNLPETGHIVVLRSKP